MNTEVVIAIVTGVFTCVIAPLVAAAVALMRAKTKNVTNERVRSLLYDAENELERVANNAVISLNQTMVSGMREKSENGKLTPDDIKEVSLAAFEKVEKGMVSDLYDVLIANKTDIESYIKDVIEKHVVYNKPVVKKDA